MKIGPVPDLQELPSTVQSVVPSSKEVSLTLQYIAVQCKLVQWSTAQCSGVRGSAVHWSIVQCSAVQICGLECRAVQSSVSRIYQSVALGIIIGQINVKIDLHQAGHLDMPSEDLIILGKVVDGFKTYYFFLFLLFNHIITLNIS